ncbi:MAG: 50S ribosomal protein L13 [Candidatus Woykebacteria bacterium GWB1_45_5]|uniref:Large ribosomal subunit protein uL13 n=2 Tax=Candidatus Woykeibacteriota TaxID=1817899 RepID=A0A1G1W3C7_9BACT|nr:MAG: 50S ribosomal protein L13 [Candidatus Woykebacteria bacterium GWA1_44_8]OGY23306.1 MAG: 50S ribosomal protein L13 [Candidatus Woykebacteria bacterium GWB1_45_5]
MIKVAEKAQPKKESETKQPERSWYLIDVKGQILGRIATKIATILMGKHKASWQPHQDLGDMVVVTNAAKVAVTGRKEEQKKYYRYSGYPGGLKTETLKSLRGRKPQDIIYHAVEGMLPRNRLGRAMIKKLFVYPGESHPHEAQKPIKLEDQRNA